MRKSDVGASAYATGVASTEPVASITTVPPAASFLLLLPILRIYGGMRKEKTLFPNIWTTQKLFQATINNSKNYTKNMKRVNLLKVSDSLIEAKRIFERQLPDYQEWIF